MGLGKCISCFEYGHSGYLNVKFQVVYLRDFLEIKRGTSLEDFAPSRSATKPQTLITKCYHFRPLRNATNLQFASSNSISHISRWDQHSKLSFSKNQVWTFFSTHFFLGNIFPSSHILPPPERFLRSPNPFRSVLGVDPHEKKHHVSSLQSSDWKTQVIMGLVEQISQEQ